MKIILFCRQCPENEDKVYKFDDPWTAAGWLTNFHAGDFDLYIDKQPFKWADELIGPEYFLSFTLDEEKRLIAKHLKWCMEIYEAFFQEE